MAIKISGTTVIDDSGNFTNIANTTATTLLGDASQLTGITKAVDVVTPANVSPFDGETGVVFNPILKASEFVSLFNRSHANTQFQVSVDENFSNTDVDVFTGANTSVEVTLDEGNDYFFRVRYFDDAGCCSCFSTPTTFNVENLFNVLGESICGGFYAGAISTAGTCYYLVLSPNSGGCIGAVCRWGIGVNGVKDFLNGYNNTYTYLANATAEAGNWTATRTINDFSDWYLPGANEMRCFYLNRNCLPAGEGFSGQYWSSTQDSPSGAYSLSMDNGNIDGIGRNKGQCAKVRAARREPFPS